MQRGITDVSAVVPYTWEHRVVVYALSDTGFMASLRELPGGDPDAVDAVAFPVPLDDADPLAATAGVRVALHPRMLAREDAARDRLVRHELTHVALGERDDDVPTWLSEGIAEWVSVAPLAPQDRALSTASLVAAREGLESGDLDLPASEVFNGSTSGAIDEEALFYLRSRGVPHRDATNLLTLAFLAEAVEEIEDETLSAQVVEKISAWLLRRSA